MRHLCPPLDGADLVDGLNRGGEAAVDAKYLVVDDGSQWQQVEYLCAHAPHVDAAVLAEALVVEAVHLRSLLLITWRSRVYQIYLGVAYIKEIVLDKFNCVHNC